MDWFLYVTRCSIWYHLYNFKNVKNTHERVLLLVKFQAKTYNFTKRNTPPWLFFTIFKFHKWYQMAQSILYDRNFQHERVKTFVPDSNKVYKRKPGFFSSSFFCVFGARFFAMTKKTLLMPQRMRHKSRWKPLTISAKRSILDVWQGSEYASDIKIYPRGVFRTLTN